jgi:hypothetical protein
MALLWQLALPWETVAIKARECAVLQHETVFILGAGASQPYNFPTGWGLLEDLRRYTVEQLGEFVKPQPRYSAPPLFEALRTTGETSIDAVLEGQEDIREAGKTLIARWLLQSERIERDRVPRVDPPRAWYRELFTAMVGRTLEEFRRNKVTIFTYNYDRSLDNFLVEALRAKYRNKSPEEYAQALDCIGPWHLHGQLGALPSLPVEGVPTVPYGGDEEALTDGNVAEAASGISIIDQANPIGHVFAQARDAISAAERVVFLGFGFDETNVERLHFQDCLGDQELFATAMGPPRQQSNVSKALTPRSVAIGHLTEDTLGYLQRHHHILDRLRPP